MKITKTSAFIFTIIICSMALSNCSYPNVNKDEGSWNKQTWIDPTTGCQYLFWQYGNQGSSNYTMTLTPKIGNDKMPVCDKEKQSD